MSKKGSANDKFIFTKIFLRWLAATQFAATNARHGWPGYDEPYIKATYEIYMTHDESYQTLSSYPLFEIIPK